MISNVISSSDLLISRLDVTVWLDVPVPEELLESEESLETQELPEPPELLDLMEMLEETTLDVLDTPELLEHQD